MRRRPSSRVVVARPEDVARVDEINMDISKTLKILARERQILLDLRKERKEAIRRATRRAI